ncbi:LON peptidase substrate-binding domain-containing protein [Actinospongicola halichondriae]|uniref:LON peptidase substrate-binding domain-containing protein n=1 Tax=Actinospongicola halichondriae TaxID=3236844 RepID=UPI003D3A2F9C
MAELPMFPLGSVLFPSLVLPLHVFEDRYRVLVRDVLAGNQEFGVCLIERGSEVGGGDVRSSIGTVATIQEAAELPDGRWAVIAVGTRRIRVEQWLPDDPYPRAEVVDLPDPEPMPAETELLDAVTASVSASLDKIARLGEEASASSDDLSDDPVLASYQLAAISPLGAMDRQRLLSAPTVGLRLADLHALLPAAHEMLDLRLRDTGTGTEPD